MSKRVTTTGYGIAWIVALIAGIVFFKTAAVHTTATSASAFATTPVSAVAWFIVAIASLVMLVLWIGALVAVGQQHAWAWFVALLILQLIGLGIIGMVAYAIAGPDRPVTSFTRPSVT
ncbi:MAG TPA: hypothetical protein VFJ24_07785 [Gaiellales bacterium]|nr:hypothetical protein [Gaiellales bacterium]